MKKFFFIAASIATLASCSTDGLVDDWFGTGKEGPISFNMNQKNMVRSVQNMQDVDHYNFGVFAYKEGETKNNVMANYLVGYNGTNVGYYMTAGNQTTLGDNGGLVDGQSMWQYEKLGSAEYNYAGEGFYRAEETEFMSNEANQYLRFWDLSAANTTFYAYAPYINASANGGKTVTYVDGTAQTATGADTYVMTFPNGIIKTAKNNPALSEFMYATTKVAKANYGHDVSLNFKRLNAKVNIKFWEDIPGYNVRILDLKAGTYEGVQATPAIKDVWSDGETYGPYGYRLGQYYLSNGAKIKFPAETIYQFEGELSTKVVSGTLTATPLVFAAPTASAIGDTRFTASPSDDTYYVVPKGSSDDVLSNSAIETATTGTLNADLAKTGFTFHVSYELTSTTGERITVKDATVFVPADYCNWEANKHYTYIFKITKNSNGSTDVDANVTIDPTTDPEVPTELGLYPIVFDNCTITDYEEWEGEWDITEGTGLDYYDVELSQYSIKSGTITVTINENHADAGHTANGYDAITVTPADANISYDDATHKITVGAGAAPGVYTVTYTCHSTGEFSHPKTWSEKFVVGHDYEINTNLDQVGTHGDDATKLLISTNVDAAGFTDATSAEGFSIYYPAHVTNDNKVQVEVVAGKAYVTVAQDAKPGVYKLVYMADTTGDGIRDTKVAEKKFTVVDYGFSFSKEVVYLDATAVVVNLTDPAGTAGAFSMTAATGITLDDATNKVSVANTATVGSYDVTYTVNAGTPSVVAYTKSFTVKNSYKVTLSKSTIDFNEGWDGGASTYGTQFITITPWKNGVAKTSGTSTLKVKQGSTDKTSLFTLTDNGNGTYKLQVKPQGAVTGNYTVEFEGETGVYATVDFVVTD